MATTTQGAVRQTYKDYCATPDDERYELLNGNLMMVPAPNRKHQEVLIQCRPQAGQFHRGTWARQGVRRTVRTYFCRTPTSCSPTCCAADALADLEAVGAIGPFSTSTVRRAFIRAAAQIGIHGVRPYDLRHSYGTALYRVAGDTRLVKNVLGHSDTRMTERYHLGHVRAAMRFATSRFEEDLPAPGESPPPTKRAAAGTPS